MEYVTIFYQALFSAITLLILTKLMGYRQVSQFSMFDYINSITIGSIAAELATDLEDYHRSLTAMLVYGLATVLLAILTGKSACARRGICSASPKRIKQSKANRNGF